MKTIDIHLQELFFPLPTDRFANMTRSRVWQKSLFSSKSNSGCDNVFGDDPKPMHQSCWLVDKKAFSVLHVSHFEIFYFLPLNVDRSVIYVLLVLRYSIMCGYTRIRCIEMSYSTYYVLKMSHRPSRFQNFPCIPIIYM